MSQISEEVRMRVRAQANDQCGYCRSLQKYVLGVLEIVRAAVNQPIALRLLDGYMDVEVQASSPRG